MKSKKLWIKLKKIGNKPMKIQLHTQTPKEELFLNEESSFSQALLSWYDQHARILPWREDKNPYRIWVSEIMLQQTRVDTVMPYYLRFMKALPDVEALANIDEEQLLKLWQGLGYYNRVKNMQKAAKLIVTKFSGVFPSTKEELLALPGIGDYTAGAIASIAFDEKVSAVDGNVLRVFARVLECHGDIAKNTTKKLLGEEVLKRIPCDRPGDFNQSLMELGATICLPKGSVYCEQCPVARFCQANMNQSVPNFPVKSSLKKRLILEKTVFLLQVDDEIALSKRDDKGLLAGLWEFPNVDGSLSREEALTFAQKSGWNPQKISGLPSSKMIFSHREWHMTAWWITLEERPLETHEMAMDHNHFIHEIQTDYPKNSTKDQDSRKWVWANQQEINQVYSIPSAFKTYLKSIDLGLIKELGQK